jgi:hypothetical protein
MITENDLARDRARVLADLEAGKSPEPMVVTMSPRALFPSPVAAMTTEAEKEASGPPVRVRVIAPYRVCHEGKHFVGGQTASVPAATAEHWTKMKWAAPVKKGK